MGTGANLFFNLISAVFLTLTLFIGLVVLMVAIDSMEPPVFAPDPTLEVPPTVTFPTVTPTMTPTVDPNYTPEATPTGEPTSMDEPTATVEVTETPEPTESP